MKKLLSLILSLLIALSGVMCVFGEEDEFNEYGEKINEKNEEDNQTPMFDDKLSEYQSYVDGNIIDADDDIKEYMKWFNSIPLYKRSSSDIIYPDDMTTMLTGGRIDAVKPEEYEQYMTTSLAPYIKVYHMTTEQQIYQKIKGGEWGQLIFSIAASPFDKNVILLGNDTSGIYRSDDGGKTWNLSCDGLMGLSVCTIAFDPDIEGVVYACMGGSTNKARFGYLGIYKSEDNGRNWRHVLSLDNTKRVGKLIAFGKLDSSGHRPIFAACDDITGYDSNGTGYKGIFRSYDRGESWENIGFTDKNVLNIQTTPDTDLIIANVEKGGLQISTDNGNTWFDISGTIPLEKKEEQINDEKASNTGYVVSGLNMDKNEIAAAAIDPYDSSHIIAGTFGIELYETFDCGKSWSKIDVDFGEAGIKDTAFLRTLHFSKMKKDGRARLFINMYSTTETVRYSDDYGRTFSIPDYHQEKAYFVKNWHTGWFAEAIEFSPFDDNIVYCGRGSTFRISTDGGENFYPSSSGYSGAAAYDFHFDKSGVLKYIAMIDTAMWRMAEGYEGDYIPVKDANKGKLSCSAGTSSTAVIVDPKDEKHIFYTLGGGIYGRQSYIMESADGLESAHYIESVRKIINERAEELGAASRQNLFLKYHDEDSDVIYSNWFRSYDNGKTWIENTKNVRAVCLQDNDILYATEYTNVTEPKKLYVSYNRGESWVDTGIVIPTNGKMLSFIADVADRGVIWCAEYSKVYRIDLNTGKIELNGSGANGITILDGQRLEGCALAQNPRDKNHLIFSGRDIDRNSIQAAFETRNGGKTWERIKYLSQIAGPCSIKFHPAKTQVYFGSMMGTVVYDYGVKDMLDADVILDNLGGANFE